MHTVTSTKHIHGKCVNVDQNKLETCIDHAPSTVRLRPCYTCSCRTLYAYNYVATCALLHVVKIIQQAWLHKKRVTVKIKQKNLETSFE